MTKRKKFCCTFVNADTGSIKKISRKLPQHVERWQYGIGKFRLETNVRVTFVRVVRHRSVNLHLSDVCVSSVLVIRHDCNLQHPCAMRSSKLFVQSDNDPSTGLVKFRSLEILQIVETYTGTHCNPVKDQTKRCTSQVNQSMNQSTALLSITDESSQIKQSSATIHGPVAD